MKKRKGKKRKKRGDEGKRGAKKGAEGRLLKEEAVRKLLSQHIKSL